MNPCLCRAQEDPQANSAENPLRPRAACARAVHEGNIGDTPPSRGAEALTGMSGIAGVRESYCSLQASSRENCRSSREEISFPHARGNFDEQKTTDFSQVGPLVLDGIYTELFFLAGRGRGGGLGGSAWAEGALHAVGGLGTFYHHINTRRRSSISNISNVSISSSGSNSSSERGRGGRDKGPGECTPLRATRARWRRRSRNSEIY